MQRFTEDAKKKIVKQHIQDGRTIASLSAEFGASKASISNWIRNYRQECQENDEAKSEYDLMQQIRKLQQEKFELEKENNFLKKAAAFFVKQID